MKDLIIGTIRSEHLLMMHDGLINTLGALGKKGRKSKEAHILTERHADCPFRDLVL